MESAATARHFPCRSCGADLAFKPGTDALVCPYCGAENQIARAETAVRELDFRAQLRVLAGATETVEVLTAKCTNCGAETTLRPNVTADACAFCGSSITVQAHSTRLIRPHALLPFKLNEGEAQQAFKGWLHGLWFAPNAVRQIANRPDRLSGLYIPHWTYDARTTTAYTGRRGEWYYTTERYTTTENGRPVTRTRQVRHTRWYGASGRVRVDFDDVLVVASTTLPEAYRPKIPEADLKRLVPYTDDYLAGFRTESYAVGLEDGFATACALMQPRIDTAIRHDIGGDEQQISSKRTDYDDVTFKHVLLPVWLSTYRFRDKPFRFTVNARTGEVQGERPWSAVKIAFAVLLALVVLAVFLYVYGQAQ